MANADQTEEIPSIVSCIEILLEIHGLLVLRHVAAEILLFSDFDEDDMISSRDLKEVVDRLTGEQTLSDEDMQQLIDNVSYREETGIGGRKSSRKCMYRKDFYPRNTDFNNVLDSRYSTLYKWGRK